MLNILIITDLPVEQKNKVKEQLNNGKLHPKDGKMLLARTIVRMYHGVQESQKAEETFKTVFQKGPLPDEIPVMKWKGEMVVPIVELLVELKLLKSKTESRKMIQNGGVRVDTVKINDNICK